jgi:hypothetical protein
MCVVRFKGITVVVGAVTALSISIPGKLGGVAGAADSLQPPAPREMSKVPEFVPIVNFSEFVLAMQAFAAQNPSDSQVAAEALSAKFAAGLDGEKGEQRPAPQQAAAEPVKAQSVIVTRPVEVAVVPSVPEPNEQLPQVADPVKIFTGYMAELAEAPAHRHKAEKKVASNGRSRLKKQFEPAMGLGMVIDSAEEAPPMSSLTQKKR